MPKDLCKIISDKKLSEEEKLQALKAALAEGADVNLPGANGHYPLHILFDERNSSPDIIKFLLELGANFSIEYLHQKQPIHKAIVEGWLDIVKMLFERKVYLYNWYTQKTHAQFDAEMFHYQYASNCIELVSCELTPVSIAIQNLRAEILDFILSYEPVIQQEFNKLGLKIAPFMEQIYTRFLPENNESEASIDIYNVYPIHLLAFDFPKRRPIRFMLDDWRETLKILLKQGCDINQPIPDTDQDNLLHLLSKSPEDWHTLDAMKSAIELGANPYQKNNQGKTPLITCYEDVDGLARFLCEKGYDLNRVWQPENALPKNFNFETVLKYFPKYYVNFCHNEEISEKNLGGIINRTVTEKTIKSFTQIESYRLAFKASFIDNKKDNYNVEKLKKWSITNIEQLKTLDISQEEWALHLNVLAACLVTEPKYIDDDLRKLLAEAFMVGIESMLAKEKFEAQHLSILKVVLENRTYVTKEIVSNITHYYLKLYQKFFTQLASLKLLALDTLLTHAHDFAEDTEIAPQEMNVIANIFKIAPVKTIKAENGFYHLSFFCAESSSSSGEENSNDLLNNSDNDSSTFSKSKRSISEVEGEGTEQPSPKRYKI